VETGLFPILRKLDCVVAASRFAVSFLAFVRKLSDDAIISAYSVKDYKLVPNLSSYELARNFYVCVYR
jgi:hypothetical protein